LDLGHRRLNSFELTGEEKPSFGGCNEAPAMPVVVFRLR
jgi:hypothetical protein